MSEEDGSAPPANVEERAQVALQGVAQTEAVALAAALAGVIYGCAVASQHAGTRRLTVRDMMHLAAEAVGNCSGFTPAAKAFAQKIVSDAFDPKPQPKKGGHLKSV